MFQQASSSRPPLASSTIPAVVQQASSRGTTTHPLLRKGPPLGAAGLRRGFVRLQRAAGEGGLVGGTQTTPFEDEKSVPHFEGYPCQLLRPSVSMTEVQRLHNACKSWIIQRRTALRCAVGKWMGMDKAEKSPAGGANVASLPPTQRSRISNGSALVVGVDGRSTWVRRLRDLVTLHVADLGGEGAISEAEKSIVRRAAVLTVELERLEARFAAAAECADKDDLDLYQRTAGNLRRLLEAVGLQRRAKDVTPSLSDYLKAKTVEGSPS